MGRFRVSLIKNVEFNLWHEKQIDYWQLDTETMIYSKMEEMKLRKVFKQEIMEKIENHLLNNYLNCEET